MPNREHDLSDDFFDKANLTGEDDLPFSIESTVSSISEILSVYVKPYTDRTDEIMLIGMGERAEELIAINQVFDPQHITAVDPSHALTVAFKRWFSYTAKHRDAQSIKLAAKTRILNKSLGDTTRSADIVFAFSLSPHLQKTGDIRSLADRTRGLLVVTAFKNSGIWWNDLTEPEYIDRQLMSCLDLVPLVRMQKLDYPTDDGHIWVMRKNPAA